LDCDGFCLRHSFSFSFEFLRVSIVSSKIFKLSLTLKHSK